MSPVATVCAFAVGAALLALWLAARFPTLGPKTVSRAIAAAAIAFALQSPIVSLIAMARHSMGVAPALLLVALPALTLLFWTSACLLRSLAGAHSR